MKKFLLFSLSAFFLFNNSSLKAQSCFNVAAGNDTTISCLQSCLDLKARIPDIKSTDDYQVVSIPYQPFPFTNAGGILVDPSYMDDRFSPAIALPFTFCFYGQTYNSCTVGTNGIISFDTSNAGKENGYLLPDTIPSSVGVQNTDTYYPMATIMGPYHDIDPSTATPQQPDKKVEYIIVGTAPCRKLILNFYKIPYYNCGAAIVTQQMVLYEGTGIIDIFLKDKPFACGASIVQTAILGIQNWNRDSAVVVPGRNNTSWSATNEGWRFVPSGSTSLLDSVALYKNGVWVTTGTTVPLGNGELEATFSSICQSEDSMSYAVRAFYRQCNNPAIQTEGSDTIIVYKTLNPLNVTATNALCNAGNGTITINSPTAPNIEYSIDGGANWQTPPMFNAPAGTYTVLARVIGSLCGGSTTATIAEPTALTLLSTSTDADCSNKTGTITLTAGDGTPGYQYTIDNFVTSQLTGQFINLAVGTYNNLKIKDANGCLKSISQSVALLDTMRLELGPDSTICFGTSITLIPQTNALTDTFKWTPPPPLINYDTIRTPIATPNDTTKFYLTAKWGVCTRKDSIIINVLHKPVADAGKDTTVCYKTDATLFGSASNLSGTVNFAWRPPDSLDSPNMAVTRVRLDTTRQFTLTVTDNYGCNFSVTDSVIVTMQSPLVAFAGNDTIAIINRDHQLLATGRNAVDFVWSPVAPLNNPFIANPIAVMKNDTYFYVHITDAIGCSDDDTIFIKVYEGPTYYLPNAFTPNGDGLNDVFFPTPVGIRTTEYFRVFDRYGKLMYQTTAWLQGWDGTLKGKPASSGTYVWIIKGIDKNGSVVEMKGTVILLR